MHTFADVQCVPSPLWSPGWRGQGEEEAGWVTDRRALNTGNTVQRAVGSVPPYLYDGSLEKLILTDCWCVPGLVLVSVTC